MPVVIDVATQDFPDAAQRFNWCNCQQEAPALIARLGDTTPDALSTTVVAAPVTPIFDFSFWEQQLTGGGGSMPTASTGSYGSMSPSVLTPIPSLASAFVPGLAVAALAWFFWPKIASRRGKR